MLANEVLAELLCLVDVSESCYPFVAGGIVDSDQPLPGEWLVMPQGSVSGLGTEAGDIRTIVAPQAADRQQCPTAASHIVHRMHPGRCERRRAADKTLTTWPGGRGCGM